MEKVQVGTKVRRLGIERTNVAEGTKCRVVLLDDCARVKHIGWDEERKKRVELTQDLVIRYGFRPMTNYYYLIAKLNTDMNGNVVGDQFVVEYLQLSENLNNDFADLIQEFGAFTSLSLSKVAKKGPQGQDYSYIKATPSNYQLDPTLMEAINRIKYDERAIEAMWQIVDRSTSITPEEYITLREGGDGQPAIAAPQSQAPRQISQPRPAQVAAPQMPQAPNNFGDEFANEGGFDEDFQ